MAKRGPKPKAKLDMFAVNQLVKNLSDCAADMSLRYREQAQLIQLQRQQLIEREAEFTKMTQDLIKTNGPAIVAAALEDTKNARNVGTEPIPADFTQLFGDSEKAPSVDQNSNKQ